MNTAGSQEKAEKKGWLSVYSNKLCFPGWKQRWVVLYRHPVPKLCLYADRSECLLEGEAKCVVELAAVKVLSKPKFPFWGRAFNVHKSKQYVFQIVADTTQPELLIFAASNYQEKERWVYAISEIVNPIIPVKKAPEPTRYKLPNDSEMFPVLSKSQILASSPSCAALQENFGNIFTDPAMAPFSKKEIALLKKIQIMNFSLPDFDSLSASDYSKQDVEPLTSDDILKTYYAFLSCPMATGGSRLLERKVLLFTLLRKFKQYATKIALEIFEKHFAPPNQFNKCFKFGSSVMAEFLCDYSSLGAQNSASLVKLDALLKGQAKVLEKLLLVPELSVDLFTAVECHGFVILVKLFVPEVESGVKLDTVDAVQEICSKICMQAQKSTEAIGYELDGKLFTHIRYNLDNFTTNVCYDALFENVVLLQNLPNSTIFFNCPLNQLSQALLNDEFIHLRYFALLKIFSFAISTVVHEQMRDFYLRNQLLSSMEEHISFLNSINDPEFFATFVRPKIVEFFPCLFESIQFEDFDSVDKRNLLKAISIELNLELRGNLSSSSRLQSSDVLLKKQQDLFHLDWIKLDGSPMERLYVLLASKFPPSKLVKDEQIAKCFLQLIDQEGYNGDQKLLLVCFAAYFCPPDCHILRSECLVKFLQYSYDVTDKVASAAAVLERVKQELVNYCGFDSLNCLEVYHSFGETAFRLNNFAFSFAIYQECLTVCCKFLGRNHPQTIEFQERSARCQMLMGQFDNAIVSLHECRRYFQESEDFYQLGKIMFLISRSLYLKGDISSTLEFIDKSIDSLKASLEPSEHSPILVEALLFRAKVCESQFSLTHSLTSIITPQVRYFLSLAEQSYEQVIEYVSGTVGASKAHSELYEIVEKLIRISMLLLDITTKEYVMMLARRFNSTSLACIEPMERDNFIVQCISCLPSKFFASLSTLPLHGPQEMEHARERLYYVAYKVSGLE